MITTVTNKKLKLAPYYLIEDEGQTIYVVSSGLNGTEFNKTVGFIGNFPTMQTYIALYGSGILLMQRNDEAGEAKEFKFVTLNPLKQVIVPTGWAACLVNTGKSYLVVLVTGVLDKKYISEKPVLDKNGLAYFVVEKKGEISFEQNPNYQVHPQIASE